jgi:2,4-dienoyl-CoA reductase-like NADH-dependent reductase (Old Yellow Enzyme family)/thioredoxin reductase
MIVILEGGNNMSQRQQFKRLFEPVRIGTMVLKNRIVMLPHATNFATGDGFVTEQLKNYYAHRAREVGLVIIEIGCVDTPLGKGVVRELHLDDDKYIPGLIELVQVIHDNGAKISFQLHHAGPNSAGHPLVAASAIPFSPFNPTPKELTVPEIQDIISCYVKTAERVRKAGADALEVVASGGYLVWSFLSPLWNKRQDEYGGDLKGRARLLIEIIQAIRTSLGKTYPMTIRLAVGEFGTEEGMTVEESQQVARMSQDAGIDAITMTAIGYAADALKIVPHEPGQLLPLAEAIKEAVTIPVISAGRMDLELGERAIEEEKADLVGICRRLIADPEYVGKAAAGRSEDIRPCTGCLNECAGRVVLGADSLRCQVNPVCGWEGEYGPIGAAEKPKKIIVVGGGPAGMEVAITAAQRGHEVTLYEKEPRLGGQLLLASIPPGKDSLESLTNYLTVQVKKFGVEVHLGKEVAPAMVEAANPDTVVIATGIVSIVPEIPGMDKANVTSFEDVLTGKAEVGERVIIIGGELVGCETAEYLVDKGKKVTIVEILPSLLIKEGVLGMLFQARLSQKGVTMLAGVKHQEFNDNSLSLTTKDGDQKTIEADTIVIAAGATANNELWEALKDRVPEIHCVGDCVEPGNIYAAISGGYSIGRRI